MGRADFVGFQVEIIGQEHERASLHEVIAGVFQVIEVFAK